MVSQLHGARGPKTPESRPKTQEVITRKPLEDAPSLASEGVISRSLTGRMTAKEAYALTHQRMTAKEAAGAALQRNVAQAASRPGVDRHPGIAEIQAKLDVPTSTSGQPMPEAVQQKMEGAFGADFSGVRIHPGSDRAVALGAVAYTQGSDIHVAPGRWAPQTTQGQELLGHELAHVQQQRAGRVRATAQLKGVALNDDPALEAEADALGARAARGDRLVREGGAAGLHVGGPLAATQLAKEKKEAEPPTFTGRTPPNGSVIRARVHPTTEGAELYGRFEVDAENLTIGGVQAEYRQYVKGWYKVNGQDFPQRTGSDKTGPLLSSEWQEDGTIHNGAYGYRDDMDDLSYYMASTGTKRRNGSRFYCRDTPGIEADQPEETEIAFYLQFHGRLINPADGTVYEAREWTVIGHARKDATSGTWADVT